MWTAEIRPPTAWLLRYIHFPSITLPSSPLAVESEPPNWRLTCSSVRSNSHVGEQNTVQSVPFAALLTGDQSGYCPVSPSLLCTATLACAPSHQHNTSLVHYQNPGWLNLYSMTSDIPHYIHNHSSRLNEQKPQLRDNLTHHLDI